MYSLLISIVSAKSTTAFTFGFLPGPPFLPILNSDSREDNRGRGIEGDEEEAGGDDRIVKMKGKVEAVIENEEGEDGVVEMKGEVEVVVENV